MSCMDKKAISEAAQEVREDGASLNWVVCSYDGNKIAVKDKGEDLEDMRQLMIDIDDRAFAYARFTTGDGMSIRTKFAFLTYYGNNISPIAKARCSTDMPNLKTVLGNIAKDFTFDREMPPIEDMIVEIKKAGGANYDGQAS